MFVKLWGNVHYVSGEGKKGGKRGDRPQEKKACVPAKPSQGKARQGTKRGMRAKHACGHQPTCFVVVLPTTTPTHHSLSFVLSCLFPCPLPFPACVCVCVSDGGWAWWLVACGLVQAHVWPSRHHHSLALCLLPHPFFLSLLPPFLSFPLPLPLPLVVVVDEKRQVGRHAIHTPPSPLCLVPCVVVGLWVWCVVVLVGTPRLYGWHQWLWLVCLATGATHHACGASGASLCGAGVHVPTPFPTHSHTGMAHHHATHTHTRLVAGPLWSLVCVCVWARCWLSPRLARHSHHHPLLLPHSTPPVLLLLLLVVVVVDVVVAAWVLWRVWPLGPLTGCAGAVHSPIHTHTHTRGGGHVVVVAVCVVWLPPPLCAIPTNHHHCVRCPALSAVCACVRVSGGTRHSGALWWHARWCVAERAPCPPHPPPTLSTLVRSLSSRSPSLTSHTHTQMARLTPHTHMAWFVWLHPCTTASEHTPWCTALALTTTCVLLVCVVVCTSTHSFFFHSHTQRGKWFVVSCCSKVSPERERG